LTDVEEEVLRCTWRKFSRSSSSGILRHWKEVSLRRTCTALHLVEKLLQHKCQVRQHAAPTYDCSVYRGRLLRYCLWQRGWTAWLAEYYGAAQKLQHKFI